MPDEVTETTARSVVGVDGSPGSKIALVWAMDQAMTKVLDDTIAEVAGETGSPVTVLPRVVQGHAAETLLKAAAGAQLLVVGSRGHSTFAGIMLGSVSQHRVQRAPCPVVVVPSAAGAR